MQSSVQTDKYIIADHLKAASFMIADGIKPGPKGQGYVLRRLIRRSLVRLFKLGVELPNQAFFTEILEAIIGVYDNVYPELLENKQIIIDYLNQESDKFNRAKKTGEKNWQKILAKLPDDSKEIILADQIWDQYQTFGVPLELSEMLLEEKGLVADKKHLEDLIATHQSLSQTTGSGQFKSGLGEDNEKTTKLHTTTHILHQILREIYGQTVKQTGSAITTEKARFDFTLTVTPTPQELEIIKTKVQNLIDKNLDMKSIETTPEKAKEMGAIGLFGEKYGQVVSVYRLVDGNDIPYSQEFCTGPHVKNTAEIGKFKILKCKSLGQGVKRMEFDVE